MNTAQDSTTATLDRGDLEERVKQMYTEVAERPAGEFHFRIGRPLAEELGYATADLDRIPAAAIESFAGVGYYFGLAAIEPGETVLDLGSGSGMDVFVAALKTGPSGTVLGIDMTAAQLAKASELAAEAGIDNVAFREGHIERLPVDDGSIDVVISNGVINLSPDKQAVFNEAARVLRPGGRLAFTDIVSEHQLPENIVCDAALWAACIGGAMQVDNCVAAVEATGLKIETVRDNPEYGFISDQAKGATDKYAVKSVSILARKPA